MSNVCMKLQEIEDLRQILNRAVQLKNGNLNDGEIASLSIRLDHLIVAYEQEKLRQKRAGSEKW